MSTGLPRGVPKWSKREKAWATREAGPLGRDQVVRREGARDVYAASEVSSVKRSCSRRVIIFLIM
jgi:hypothetical protein